MNRIGVVLVNYKTINETNKTIKMYSRMNTISKIVVVNNSLENMNVFFRNKKTEIIEIRENIGYSKANNIGAKRLIQLGAEYIIISNSDISIDEKSIINSINYLKENKKMAAISPRMLNEKGEKEYLKYYPLGLFRIVIRIFMSERELDRITEKKLKIINNCVTQKSIPGSFTIIKSDAFKKFNGYDEKVFLYREEEILAKRIDNIDMYECICVDNFYIHKHKYSNENSAIKLKRLNLVLESERYYFKNYVNHNLFSNMLVNILQRIYIISRKVVWRIYDIKK